MNYPSYPRHIPFSFIGNTTCHSLPAPRRGDLIQAAMITKAMK